MLLSQQVVARNRNLIQRLFNGDPPYTDSQARTENVKTNVNFLEATRIASNATNQLNNAFEKGDRYFTVRINNGPRNMRSMWGDIITAEINKLLKLNRTYRASRESARAQVVLHGIGPLIWKNRRHPCPTSAAVEDVIVPSGTLTSMENLDRFAVYREWTWNQLYEMTQGKAVDPGWNKDYVKAILASLYKKGPEPIYQGSRWLFPQKISEDLKEGAAQFVASSLPKLLCWDFFYRDEDNGKWCRKCVMDYRTLVNEGTLNDKQNVYKNQEFIYEKEGYADEISEIIHWYIGNCSNVSPYRYNSVRSVGYLLFGPCLLQNKLRCRTMDHILQSLLTWFKNTSDDHREKLGMIDLQNFGILPDGVSMVTSGERHVVDWELVMMGLNQNRQLMAESSQSFIPDMSGGPQKEMTATETLVRQNTSVNLTAAVQNQLGNQSLYESYEICRRFCIKNNPDPMVVKFRERIQKKGVSLDALDCEEWDIIPEMTVGGGNKAVELTVTQALMQEMFPLADPNGQRIISRRRYMALTDNADEALEVIPEAPQPPEEEVQYAQGAFAVLMQEMPFRVKEGINHMAYAGTLMQMFAFKLKQLQQLAGQPSALTIVAEGVAGLATVGQHIQQEIIKIGQYEPQREMAKQMMKGLEDGMKSLQELAQMVQEQSQQSQQQMDPEVQARVQAMMIQAQSKAQIDQQKAEQKRQEKQIGWSEENQRRNATTAAEIQRGHAKAAAEIQQGHALSAAEIARKRIESKADLENNFQHA